MMKKIAFCLLFIIGSFHAIASIDTVLVYSKSMNKSIKALVIKPDTYAKNNPIPVVYLLHGHGANYMQWLNNAPSIVQQGKEMN